LLLFSVINPGWNGLFVGLTQDDDKKRPNFAVDRRNVFVNNDYSFLGNMFFIFSGCMEALL
jgi:hypothetical protein